MTTAVIAAAAAGPVPRLDVVPVSARCGECGYDVSRTDPSGNCPECGLPAAMADQYFSPVPVADLGRWMTGSFGALVAGFGLVIATPLCLSALEAAWNRSGDAFFYGYVGAVGIIAVLSAAHAIAATWMLRPDAVLPSRAAFRVGALAMVWSSFAVYMLVLAVSAWFIRSLGLELTLRLACVTGLHFCFFVILAAFERLARGLASLRQWQAVRQCRWGYIGILVVIVTAIVLLLLPASKAAMVAPGAVVLSILFVLVSIYHVARAHESLRRQFQRMKPDEQ